MYTQVQALKKVAQEVIIGEIQKNSSNSDSMRQFCKDLVEQMGTSSTYVDAVYTTLNSQELTTIDWAISTNQHFFITNLLQEIIVSGTAKQKDELQLGLETSFAKPGLKQFWSDFLSSPTANLLKQYCLATNNFKLAICFFPIDRVLCDNNQYPLHFFASRGMVTMVDTLLSQKKVQLNTTIVIDGQSFTAIDLAIRNKHYIIVNLLLTNGATLPLEQIALLPAKLEGVGSEALSSQASSSDNSGVVKDPQEEPNPIMTMIQLGYYSAITELLYNIIKIIKESKDPSAELLIHYFERNLLLACSKLGSAGNVANFLKSLDAYKAKQLSFAFGYEKLAILFFPMDSYILAGSPTPETELHHFACMGPKDKLQEALVSSKASLNIPVYIDESDIGKTPLDLACHNEHFGSALILLKNGAQCGIPTSKETMIRRMLDLNLSEELVELLDVFCSSSPEDLQLFLSILNKQEKLPVGMTRYLLEKPNEFWVKILPSAWQDISVLLGLIKNALESTNKTKEKQELYKLACSTAESYSQNIDSLKKSKAKAASSSQASPSGNLEFVEAARAKIKLAKELVQGNDTENYIALIQEIIKTPILFSVFITTEEEGSNILSWAIESGHYHVINALLEAIISDSKKETMIEEFQAALAKAYQKLNMKKESASKFLQSLSAYQLKQLSLAHGYAELAKYFFPMNPLFPPYDKVAELHYFASLGLKDELKKALDSDSTPLNTSIKNDPDKPGKTPLDHACHNEHFDIALILLRKGAECTTPTSKETMIRRILALNLNEHLMELLDIFNSSSSPDNLLLLLQVLSQQKELFSGAAQYLSEQPNELWLKILLSTWQKDTSGLLGLIKNALQSTNKTNEKQELYKLACSTAENYSKNFDSFVQSIFPSKKAKPKKQKKLNTATSPQISQSVMPRAEVSENGSTSPHLPVDEPSSSSEPITFKQNQQEAQIYEVSETPQPFNIQEAAIVSTVKSIDSPMPASSAESDTTSKIQLSTSNPEINLEQVANSASFEPAHLSSQSTISAPDTTSPDVEQTLETQTALAHQPPSKLQKSTSNSNETFMSLWFKFLKTHCINSLEKMEELLKALSSYKKKQNFLRHILSLELDELNKPILIDGQNRTALELACQHGCFNSAILLVEQGAEITDYCEQVWNQRMQYKIDMLFEKSNSWDKVLQKFGETGRLEPSRIRYLSALTDSQWLEMLPKQFPHRNKLILQLIRHILEATNSAEKRVLLHRLACSRSYDYDENYRQLQQSTNLDFSKPIVILRRPTKDSKASASSLSSAAKSPQPAPSLNNLNFFRATNGPAKNHRQSQQPFVYGRKTTPDSQASASSSSSMANTAQPAGPFSPEIATSSKVPVFHQSMASSLVQATLDYIEHLESKNPDEVIQKLDVVIAARPDLRGFADKVKECISNAAQLHADGKFKDLSYAIFNIRKFLMNLGPESYPNSYDDKLLGYQVENLNKHLATSSPISSPTP